MSYLTVVNSQYESCLVRSSTGKTFPVTLHKNIRGLVSIHDRVDVRKSKVTGEWIAIDYHTQ